MAEPRSYQILLHMQAALRASSTGAGYFFSAESDAVSIDPVDVIEIVLGRASKTPFFVIELGVTGRPTYQPANQMLEFLQFNVIAFANAAHLDPASRVNVYERLCADIEKALTVDISRGGLATDTRIAGKQMQVTTGSLRVVAIVQLEVRTYREYGKPNG